MDRLFAVGFREGGHARIPDSVHNEERSCSIVLVLHARVNTDDVNIRVAVVYHLCRALDVQACDTGDF